MELDWTQSNLNSDERKYKITYCYIFTWFSMFVSEALLIGSYIYFNAPKFLDWEFIGIERKLLYDLKVETHIMVLYHHN